MVEGSIFLYTSFNSPSYMIYKAIQSYARNVQLINNYRYWLECDMDKKIVEQAGRWWKGLERERNGEAESCGCIQQRRYVSKETHCRPGSLRFEILFQFIPLPHPLDTFCSFWVHLRQWWGKHKIGIESLRLPNKYKFHSFSIPVSKVRERKYVKEEWVCSRFLSGKYCN